MSALEKAPWRRLKPSESRGQPGRGRTYLALQCEFPARSSLPRRKSETPVLAQVASTVLSPRTRLQRISVAVCDAFRAGGGEASVLTRLPAERASKAAMAGSVERTSAGVGADRRAGRRQRTADSGERGQRAWRRERRRAGI